MDLIKAHAYGNDFLFAPIDQTAEAERAILARRVCDRHLGVGADGLVLYALTATGATMTLYNADGGVARGVGERRAVSGGHRGRGDGCSRGGHRDRCRRDPVDTGGLVRRPDDGSRR